MGDKPWHIVVAEPYDDPVMARLATVATVTILPRCDEAALMVAVRDCDALLVRTKSRITRQIIANAARLRVIGRGGTGLDSIDLAAAAERGIKVVYTPAASTDAVADLTVGMMIALVRGFRSCDLAVRVDSFIQQRDAQQARELKEMTLGIIGMGRIGRAVAKRCHRGFDMAVIYHDIVEPGLLDFVATARSMEEVYTEADIVSLHVPLTEMTRGLIGVNALPLFKRGAYLVNTSRGAVVDGVALAAALERGHLAGAALDVFETEPPPADHPLLRAPNTLFTPHIGAKTKTSLARMNAVVEDVLRVLKGEEPHYPA